MTSQRPRLVVVVGPTASGKSELALALAESMGGEIVSADSQQVYRGMDIGTGKVSVEDRARVRHHLIDVVDPSEEMTANWFAEQADDVIGRALVPLVVAGGTGLYVRALLLGLFSGPEADPELRTRLTAEADLAGLDALWTRLESVDPEAAGRIDRRDQKRIIRALEIFESTGVPQSEHFRRHNHRDVPARYPHRLLCLDPPRDELYRSIDRRVDDMMERGLVGEVLGLRERGVGPQHRSQQAIGYAEVHRHLDGEISLVESIRLIKRNSRRYARRQLSWYRNGPSADQVEWYPRKSEVDLDSLKRYLRRSA